MTIGEKIKKRRTELGLTADELGAKINKDRATIYRYESSEIENMPVPIIAPLAQALNISPAYLMGWTDEENLIIEKHPLMKIYDSLNKAGQENLMGYATDLSEMDKYKKCPDSKQNIG